MTFWEDDYKEMQVKYTRLLVSLSAIISEINHLDEVCRKIDINRRENAVAMSVTIQESDEKYSFDDIRKNIPTLIENLKKQSAKFGVNWKDLL